jgi:hypothetical protein
MRQVKLALAQLADHRAAQVRVLDRRRRNISGMKLVGRPLMVPLFVGHGSHQGDLVHDLGRLVPSLGDGDRGNGGRDRLGLAAVLGARLGVERLELAGAAGHPEQNACPLLPAQVGGMNGHPIGETDRNRRRGGQPGRSQRDRLEEVAAVDHAGPIHRHVHDLFFECHGSLPHCSQE